MKIKRITRKSVLLTLGQGTEINWGYGYLNGTLNFTGPVTIQGAKGAVLGYESYPPGLTVHPKSFTVRKDGKIWVELEKPILLMR